MATAFDGHCHWSSSPGTDRDSPRKHPETDRALIKSYQLQLDSHQGLPDVRRGDFDCRKEV